MEAVGALGVGIVLGIRHAADPDHVVAIVQLVRPGGGTTRAARTALCWGLGHSLTTLGLGSVIVLGGLRAPAGLEAVAELLVAAMLVALAWKAPHLQTAAGVPRSGLRAILVGLVHGTAGAAGASVVALALVPDRSDAFLSLGAMCLGTTAAMLGLTVSLVATSAHLSTRILSGLVTGSRIVALAVAAVIAWSVAFP
jgi:hypothetical protein